MLSWDTWYPRKASYWIRKKQSAIVHMPTSKTPKDVKVFNGMAQYYRCFIKDFALIIVSITKLLRKIEAFEWIVECQQTWERIKQCYMDAPILISLHWDIEFHVHTNVSNLVVKVMLTQNLIEKCNQPITYESQLLNNVEQNYIMTEKEALIVVYVLHISSLLAR